MQVIYNVVTATDVSYGKKCNIEDIIPYHEKSTFIIRGENEMQCLNKICTYFEALYFNFDGKFEKCISTANEITFILSKRIINARYCRIINVRAIQIVKDGIYYL